MIVIIGAGISGLTVGNTLPGSTDFVILEKENRAGGLCTQYSSDAYHFDFAGHYFHFQDYPDIKTYLENFCRFKEFPRKSKTFLLNRFIPFPVQFHLSYLPAQFKDNILRQILANKERLSRFGFSTDNLYDFLRFHFGETLFKLFFEPFLSKYYRWDLKNLAAEMDRGSIPIPDKAHVVAGFKGKKFSSAGYNPVIYYPRSSLLDFIEKYTAPIRERINLNEEVIRIDSDRREVKTRFSTYSYDRLVTSMPLKQLLRIIEPQGRFPSHYRLQNVSTVLVNAVLTHRRKRVHWVYLAEKTFPFYRVGLYAAHPYPAAYLEKNVLPGTLSHTVDHEQLRRETAFTLKELKMIHHDDEIVHLDARVIPFSYVIFDKNWKNTVPALLENLKKYGIYSIGRYGTWNYSYMSHDIQTARQCARFIASGGPSGSRFL